MPSGGDYFGSGFVQGLGQSLQALPGIMAEKRRRDVEREELTLKKAILQSQLKERQSKDRLFDLYTSDPGKFMQQIAGGLLGGLNGQGVAAPSPAPSSPLRDSLVGGAPSGGPLPGLGGPPATPDVSAAAPQVPQPTGAGMGAQPQGEYTLDRATVNPFDPFKTTFSIGRRKMTSKVDPYEVSPGKIQMMNTITDDQGNVVKVVPVPELGGPAPSAEMQQAQAAARSLGAPPGAINGIAGALIAIRDIPDPNQRMIALQKIQQEAWHFGQVAAQTPGSAGADYDIIAPDFGPIVKEGQRVAAEGAAMKTGAEATARTKVEAEQAGPIAEAKARGVAAAQLRPAKKLIGRLGELLDGIKLPTTGAERVSEAPRLYGESFAQSNTNIVLYESLKNGFLATLSRAAGDRGTLTDQDIGRAAALFPVVIPGVGKLPDTKKVAQAKLQELTDLLQQFVQKDPQIGTDLGMGSPEGKSNGGGGGFQLQQLVPTR